MAIIGRVNKLRRFFGWLLEPRLRPFKLILSVAGLLLILYLAQQTYQGVRFLLNINDPRNQTFVQWATGNDTERAALITAQREACPGAPFILPTDGFIGLLYEDPRSPYSSSNPHQGIDIFSEGEAGATLVYAAYDGYVTRDVGWRSALILRIPDDPLRSGNQVWLYYAHMADRRVIYAES